MLMNFRVKAECTQLSILTGVFFTLNWSTFTPKTHFVQFYLKVVSYFLSWGKNKYVTMGIRLLWKYIKN